MRRKPGVWFLIVTPLPFFFFFGYSLLIFVWLWWIFVCLGFS